MHLILFFVVLHATICINSPHSLKNVNKQLLVVARLVACCQGKINIVFFFIKLFYLYILK